MSSQRYTAARSAWDYGVPQDAAERVDATIRELLGPPGENDSFELASTGSRVVIRNMAAAIVHDLITSGVMAATIPDFPPPPRA